MKCVWRHGIFIFLLGLPAFYLHAQPKTLFRQVVDRFGSDAKGIWVQFYKGKANDSQPVLFCIGNNGKEYKGFYRYKGEEKLHLFEGKKEEGTSIKWVETNEDGEIIAYLNGSIDASKAQLLRMDLSRQFAREFHLQRTRYPKAGMKNCSEGLWLQTIEGELLESPCKLVLQHENEGLVRGVLQFKKTHSSHDIVGKCLHPDCQSILLHLMDPYGNSLGDIKLRQKNPEGNKYIASLKGKVGEMQDFELASVKRYPLLCGPGDNGADKYFYTYPFLDKKRFDRWLGLRFKAWVTEVRSKLKELDSDDLEASDDRAMAWVDIEYLGPKYVSGFLNFYNPIEKSSYREGFIFPFKEDEPRSLEDLLDDFTMARTRLDKEIKRKKERIIRRSDALTAEWLRGQAFDKVCIRAEGFCFSTDFNGIFGERKIVVPYSIVSEYLKDKRLLKL